MQHHRPFGILILALSFAGTNVDAQRFQLAITVDDLPWSGPERHVDGLTLANDRLLDALVSRGVPATGFVICDRLVGKQSLVDAWLQRGLTLGNHTAAHRNIDNTPLNHWIDDVRRCDVRLRDFTTPMYFRYPLLHQGPNPATRDSAQRALEALGYQVAPVTVDNSEWIFAAQYRDPDASAERRSRLGTLYIAHMRRAVAHARTIAQARFGREVRQILLIHANELNADFVAPLIDSLRVDGADFVSLPEALQDSIYRLPTDYAGPRGLSWLYRAMPEQSALAAWDEEEERGIEADLMDPPPGLAAVGAEIRARSAAFSMLYMQGKAADLLDFYTPDGALILPGGRRVIGHEAIQRYWTLGSNRRALEHRMHTEMLYGDDNNVTEVGRWFATSQQQGGEPVSSAGTYVVMWRRSLDGVLRMTVDTWHRDVSQ